MDTSQFNKYRLDAIDFHDWRIFYCQKSSQHISFAVEDKENEVFGWIDVFEFDGGEADTQIRVSIPHTKIKFEDLRTMIDIVCDAIDIEDDVRDIHCQSPAKGFHLMSEKSLEGLTISTGPMAPDQNGWDENPNVLLSEVIDRQTALGMMYRVLLDDENDARTRRRKDFFLQFSSARKIASLLTDLLNRADDERLREFFELIERLYIYGDNYTRNNSLRFLHLMISKRLWAITPFNDGTLAMRPDLDERG